MDDQNKYVRTGHTAGNTFAATIQPKSEATMTATENTLTAEQIRAAADARKAAILARNLAIKANWQEAVGAEDTDAGIKDMSTETQYVYVPAIDRTIEFPVRRADGLMFEAKILAAEGNTGYEPKITDETMIEKIFNTIGKFITGEFVYGEAGLILYRMPDRKMDFCQFIGFCRWNYEGGNIVGIEKITDGQQVASIKVKFGQMIVDQVIQTREFVKGMPYSGFDGRMRNVLNLMLGNDRLQNGCKLELAPINAHDFKSDGSVRRTAQEVTNSVLRYRLGTFKATPAAAKQIIDEHVAKKIGKVAIAQTLQEQREVEAKGGTFMAFEPVAQTKVDGNGEVTTVVSDGHHFIGKAVKAWTKDHRLSMLTSGKQGCTEAFLVTAAKNGWVVELQ